MQTLQIRDAVQRNGRNGVYLQVTDAQGVRYGCFEPLLFPRLTSGATVGAEVSISADGRYKNITAVGATVSTGVAGANPATGNGTLLDDATGKRILRTVALKAAVDSIGVFPLDAGGGDAAGAVISLADQYLDWLNDDWGAVVA